MKFKKLEVVVLTRDVPEHELKAGDLGTIIEVYPKGGLEVEFVRVSGENQALLTLTERDVRKIDSNDLLATRRLAKVN
ncbi:MAG: DUF4926 domain-containing protein [Chloroflexota bacterium]